MRKYQSSIEFDLPRMVGFLRAGMHVPSDAPAIRRVDDDDCASETCEPV
jgi:hypothetical protein